MKQLLIILSLLLFFSACKKEQTLFVSLDSAKTHVDFNNLITENDTLSILNSEFLYNGGGVAIGDLNGDGLQDLFFTGSQVQNKLYLNKGNLTFEDITKKANVEKQKGEWSAGINLIDINNDGKLDIYICNTFLKDPNKRKNLLYINQGNSPPTPKEGDKTSTLATPPFGEQGGFGYPTFQEAAESYGIADTTHSANAQFFDYDNDGDLDLFIGVNFMDTPYPNQYFKKVTDGTTPNRDRLYRNDWDTQKGHPVFTDVSLQAGIKWDGYSHSSLVTDFNEDGFMDIYVANDYVTNDLIYINQKNGTFKNQIASIFKHQAASAMGSDVADINNDGKLDVFTTEMMPYHNKRKKVFLNANNYTNYINNETYGYEYQYARNTLQLNRGLNPETGLPTFSDMAFMGDVQETEWSWTPLMADFDNDGHRDIFVTNGFPKDVTDHDFGAYRSTVSYLLSPMDMQSRIPQIKVPKFMFRNEGNLKFQDVSKYWGVDIAAFSNGAAYGDLDNDGDLDLVVNNIDDKAFVLQNTLNDDKKTQHQNYLRLKIEGETGNSKALGATVTAYFKGEKQIAQVISTRGYLSCSENIVHFGLGDATKVDSVIVNLKNKRSMAFTDFTLNKTNSISLKSLQNPPPQYKNLFYTFKDENPASFGLNYNNRDSDYIDFNFQRTMPYKFSQAGPSISVGDVNGDALDDIYISGSGYSDGTWFLQSKNGTFSKKQVAYKTDKNKKEEELGTLLFDADNDGDNDLYIVRGGNQYVLCVNDGKGNFKIAPNALPIETACGQAVKAADIDGDGDLDLFVGGRVLPRSYPKSDKTYILRNDSPLTPNGGMPKFTDITQQVCPELANIGLISDALFTDFNNDNQPDLILAGEWQPLIFLQNENGKFKNITNQTGISDKLGWWTSLTAADFDNDGDMDYIAGSFGQNIYFKCSPVAESTQKSEIRNPKSEIVHPLSIYAKDFDTNGLYDPFISCYWRDTAGKKQEFFYHTRDDMVKQLVTIRKKFQTYGALGTATVKNIFTEEELKGAQIMHANWMYSSFIENKGNGKFDITPLPAQAQLAPIYGMLPYDIDRDGFMDLLMVGNDYGMELLQGRADAFDGLVLKNLGKNSFKTLEMEESGFYVPHDARALTKIDLPLQNQELILATQNKGVLKVFSPNKSRFQQGESRKFLVPNKTEPKAKIVFKNGQTQIHEFYLGNGYLSQQPLSILVGSNVSRVEFMDNKGGATRKILLE
jgi:enediyne biosynthesis protein E4